MLNKIGKRVCKWKGFQHAAVKLEIFIGAEKGLKASKLSIGLEW